MDRSGDISNRLSAGRLAPTRGEIVAYASGAAATGLKSRATGIFLLIFYNQVIGLPVAAVGALISMSMIFDAVSTPILGQVSDNLRSRWGRRHPFMLAAALPLAIAFYFLWNPPANLDVAGSYWWLAIWLFVARFFDTCFELPHQALTPEFTQDYDGRTRLVAWRQFFGVLGGLGMQIIAYQVFLKPNSDGSGGILARDGYFGFALFGSIVILCAILTATFGTRRQAQQGRVNPKRKSTVKAMAVEMYESMRNRSFLILTAVLMIVAISWGVMGGLEIYMGLYFWKLSQSELAILATMSVVGGFLGVIAGPLIGRYLGKKWGLIWVFIAMVIIHVAPIVLRLTGLAPENGTNALFALIFGQTLFNAILESAVTVLGIAIFADIVEDVEVQTGRRSEGLLMSASSLMRKMVSGGGILISTMLLTITHFPVGMAPEKIPDAVLRNLGMAYVPTIVILNGIAIGLLCFFSIDRNRHEENLRKLKELADVRALAEAEQEAAIL